MKLSEFAKLMNQDLVNEWTHLKFYLYHASYIGNLESVEFREWFTEAAAGEMKHVQQFLDRLLGLGFAIPTYADQHFACHTSIVSALNYAEALELTVAQNYADRLQQLEDGLEDDKVAARYLAIFYENQLQDSYEDLERIRRMLVGVTAPNVTIRPESRE